MCGLPADFAAAVVVVMHLPPRAPSLLVEILGRACFLPVSRAQEAEPIRAGHVYVAPPGVQTVVRGAHLGLHSGPKENGHRPAIDPLFRTAAAENGERVAGVLLSGVLDDGAAGLRAVRDCGGVAIVQDPEEAAYPDMPRHAMRWADPDHILPAGEIAGLLNRLAGEHRIGRTVAGNPNVRSRSEGVLIGIPKISSAGTSTALTCPECGGAIWALEGEPLQLRCHTGHGYTAETFSSMHATGVEEALWTAERALRERAELNAMMASRWRASGNERLAGRFETLRSQADLQADRIRHVAAAWAESGPGGPGQEGPSEYTGDIPEGRRATDPVRKQPS
jgi:two-component system chemotaxis response regulator CheB